MEDHPQATHTQWQKFPVPVRGSPVFVCSHTYKPASESSSPHAAPCEQLSHWFTGSDGLEKFPVCPTTEEKNTHTGYSASASITLPLFYWESHLRAACSTHSLKELSCWLELGCLCVWVLVSFVETHHWEQSEGYFVMLQGRSWTENSRQPQEGQEGNQLQYQKIDTKQQRGYYVLYMWPYRHSSLTLWTLFTLRNDGQMILIIITNYFRRFSWIFWCTSRRQRGIEFVQSRLTYKKSLHLCFSHFTNLQLFQYQMITATVILRIKKYFQSYGPTVVV